MDFVKLRAWWAHRQGLLNRWEGMTAYDTLSRAGWARSIGGSNPYLTIFARTLASRAQIDAELQRIQIQEMPCARGCSYVVPNEDFAVALIVGQGTSEAAAMKTAVKYLGYTQAQLDQLSVEVLRALESGPMEPKELREKLGDAVSHFGDEGKKRGQTTSMSLALGRLQAEGRIRRIPVNGRLDTERYSYANWTPSPLDGYTRSKEECQVELAKRFFRWIGPVRDADFQGFSGLGVGATKKVLAQLKLTPLDENQTWWLPTDDLDEWESFETPKNPVYRLVSALDSMLLLRRDVGSHIAPEDSHRQAAGEKSIQSVVGLQDLVNNAILDRGRIVGLWEYDTFANELVTHTFVPMSADLKEEIRRTEAFIQNDIGDARAFSLDSPKSRMKRIEILRSLGD